MARSRTRPPAAVGQARRRLPRRAPRAHRPVHRGRPRPVGALHPESGGRPSASRGPSPHRTGARPGPPAWHAAEHGGGVRVPRGRRSGAASGRAGRIHGARRRSLTRRQRRDHSVRRRWLAGRRRRCSGRAAGGRRIGAGGIAGPGGELPGRGGRPASEVPVRRRGGLPDRGRDRREDQDDRGAALRQGGRRHACCRRGTAPPRRAGVGRGGRPRGVRPGRHSAAVQAG